MLKRGLPPIAGKGNRTDRSREEWAAGAVWGARSVVDNPSHSSQEARLLSVCNLPHSDEWAVLSAFEGGGGLAGGDEGSVRGAVDRDTCDVVRVHIEAHLRSGVYRCIAARVV